MWQCPWKVLKSPIRVLTSFGWKDINNNCKLIILKYSIRKRKFLVDYDALFICMETYKLLLLYESCVKMEWAAGRHSSLTCSLPFNTQNADSPS